MNGRLLAVALLLPGAAAAQTGADPTGYAFAAEVQAEIEAMRLAMKPGQGFMWRPLVRGGEAVAALEYWTRPGKPAVHPDQAEYVVVIAGEGTMISGGRLADPVTTKPTLIEGSRIEGGTTRALREIMNGNDNGREPMRLMDQVAAWQVANVLMGTPPPENGFSPTSSICCLPSPVRSSMTASHSWRVSQRQAG